MLTMANSMKEQRKKEIVGGFPFIEEELSSEGSVAMDALKHRFVAKGTTKEDELEAIFAQLGFRDPSKLSYTELLASIIPKATYEEEEMLSIAFATIAAVQTDIKARHTTETRKRSISSGKVKEREVAMEQLLFLLGQNEICLHEIGLDKSSPPMTFGAFSTIVVAERQRKPTEQGQASRRASFMVLRAASSVILCDDSSVAASSVHVADVDVGLVEDIRIFPTSAVYAEVEEGLAFERETST